MSGKNIPVRRRTCSGI